MVSRLVLSAIFMQAHITLHPHILNFVSNKKVSCHVKIIAQRMVEDTNFNTGNGTVLNC